MAPNGDMGHMALILYNIPMQKASSIGQNIHDMPINSTHAVQASRE